MESLWAQGCMPHFPQLNGDIDTDILIIGGGIAGVLTAYFLHRSGVDCLLVEKDRICRGVTQNTTAKITAQHGLCYHKIVNSRGTEIAQKYLHANQSALETYARLCEQIDCDFERKNNYVYAADRKKLEDEMRALQKIGYPAQWCEDLPLPLKTAGAVMFPQQAQFHPLKFLAKMAENLHIYENTAVREMVGNTAVTNGGRIHAKKVIITTHFPFLNKHGSYFLKLYQHRSYVLALEGAQQVRGMYVDEDQTGLSFRNYGDLLLLGGGSHRTGKKGGNWQDLRVFAGIHYPQVQEVACWATQDCMSLDSIPYIGQYSRNTPDLYVASGFNKWGMSSAMVAAQLLCDLALGKKNEWAEVFDPSRSILRPQLFINGWEAMTNLLTPTKKRCPHLGCALHWNEVERTWDCACHGSRFSEEGKVLNNPANGDLK
ncbi:MAG: FAD-dependent oxidoreductase [Eubacteriales bacterium]|nr:FAD-dependent oxidoreductase [Eubacteriales bacterium]